MICPLLVLSLLQFTLRKDSFSTRGDDQASIRSDRLEIRQERQQINSSTKMYGFFTAPVIICMYNTLSYIVFLSLLSYILIFNFGPSVSSVDIVLFVWGFTLLMEEVRQILRIFSSSTCSKLKHYISDIWNRIDCF
ncbi:hypothetical protein DPMN_049868 [Dreissena polymorpha]|uniref:Uncharacterized protein n=1 Tax=Dreissena polymorpha TaxID=45954 RepID=A0A9D4CG55_DREPO|nr:hypothetical protein DPMN_049868 [Dreissena polymorpha]